MQGFPLKSSIYYVLTLLSLNVCGQQDMLCEGHYWTEDEASLRMKQFADEWDE
ncbi:MAG: hypothetical protein GQ579_06180 [Bacteroidales bacterium]|jgi:hypothetical protein|nr:hypothetical protein [Bacteroidales bacterium]